MSVNYSAGLSPYENKGKCGMPEVTDEVEILQEKCHKLSELLVSSKVTVVHTGAGISTSAGIPDFRGPKGVWTLEKEGKSPDCSITFQDAVPTFAHRFLVSLEKAGLVHFVISQNVDGLHVRSGFPRDRLAELHGNIFARKCQLCKKEIVMDSVSPTMALNLTGEKCPLKKSRGSCRGFLRDTILDWEDALPVEQLDLSEKFCKSAELSIVMGSSLQIVPAANLPLLTKRSGGKLVIINLQPTKHDKRADLLINGTMIASACNRWNKNCLDEVLRIVADDLNISIPDYPGPTVCLKSSQPMPPLTCNSSKTSPIVKKRKQESSVTVQIKSLKRNNISSDTKSELANSSDVKNDVSFPKQEINSSCKSDVKPNNNSNCIVQQENVCSNALKQEIVDP